MKIKPLLIAFTSILLSFILFCSCGTPVGNKLDPSTDPTETDLPQALDELIDSLLPTLKTTESVQEKIFIPDFDSENYRLDKPLVHIRLLPPSDETVRNFIEARKLLDGEVITDYQASALLTKALALKFKEQYVADPEDFLYYDDLGTVLVYASSEEIRHYASCDRVERIDSGESSLYLFKEPKPSRNFGQNFLGWNRYVSIHTGEAECGTSITYRYFQSYFPVAYEKKYVNADRLELHGVRALPMTRIDTANQLDASEIASSSPYANEWRELIESYDETFFQTKSLFLISILEGSGPISHTLQQVEVIDETFYVVIEQHASHAVSDVVRSYTVILEIEKSAIENCTVFDAWMDE